MARKTTTADTRAKLLVCIVKKQDEIALTEACGIIVAAMRSTNGKRFHACLFASLYSGIGVLNDKAIRGVYPKHLCRL